MIGSHVPSPGEDSIFCLVIGLAPIAALLIVLSFHFWKTWKLRPSTQQLRRRKKQCPRCGYSMQGSINGICPECGFLVWQMAIKPKE